MAIASFTSSPLRSRKESPLSSLSHWCERKEIRQQADRLAGSDTSMVRAACRELTIMKGRPPEARAAFRESDVQYWQAKAKENGPAIDSIPLAARSRLLK